MTTGELCPFTQLDDEGKNKMEIHGDDGPAFFSEQQQYTVADAGTDTLQAGRGRSTSRPEPLTVAMGYLWSADFLELLSCLAFAAVPAIPYFTMPIQHRSTPYQKIDAGDVMLDLRLDNELVDETVSTMMLMWLAVLLPLAVQCVLGATVGSRGDVHSTMCVYAVGIGLTLFVTEFIKRLCGYLRPNFYEQCHFDKETLECQIQGSNDDWRKSFISGHASLSFFGMMTMSLYLLQRFGDSSAVAMTEVECDGVPFVLQYRAAKPSRIKRATSVLSIAPMMLAFFISCSRVVDNFHHPVDVVGGALLGTAIALFANGLWYVLILLLLPH